MNRNLKPVPISAIDREDTTFQVSTPRSNSDLATSIASIGLLIPPTLKEVDSRLVIVNGFRRVDAHRILSREAVLANILPDRCTDLECAEMAVAENALQRPLNLIERSRALALLSPHFSSLEALAKPLRAIGLIENPAMIEKILPLCRLSRRIQEAVLEGTFPLAIADALGRLDPQTREMAAELLTVLKTSLNKQREILSMLEEISLRERISLAELLRDPSIVSAVSDTEHERNVKTDHLRSILKKRRYPAIHAAEEKASLLVKSLNLSDRMKLVLPRNFEHSEFSMTLRFGSTAEFIGICRELNALMDRPELKILLSKAF